MEKNRIKRDVYFVDDSNITTAHRKYYISIAIIFILCVYSLVNLIHGTFGIGLLIAVVSLPLLILIAKKNKAIAAHSFGYHHFLIIMNDGDSKKDTRVKVDEKTWCHYQVDECLSDEECKKLKASSVDLGKSS